MSEFNPGEQPRGYRERGKTRGDRRRELRGGGKPDDPSRRKFLKLALGTAAAVGLGVVAPSLFKEPETKTFKEKVSTFNLDMAEDPEKLRAFTEVLADVYLELTPSTRITKADLVGPDKTNFYKARKDFVQAVKNVSPKRDTQEEHWGYAHYPTKQVFIDLSYIRRNLRIDPSLKNRTGLLLANTLFHEWGHLDLEERTEVGFINNPRMSIELSDGQIIEFKRYHGGSVVQDGTDVNPLFWRFDEVWNETLAVRRVYEAVGRDNTVDLEYAPIYYPNGLDVFFPFTFDIPLRTLYEMHATSDFEGFAELIGRKLPRDQTELMRGMNLILAIDSADSAIIQETGILSVIPPQK